MSLSLAENVIIAGADNRPPMLDKTNYSSWASLVEPRNENTLATVIARTYTDLTDEEKIRESVDIKATNITNNQLRTSSNLRNQATIQDGRVTVQTIQGRQTQRYANTGAKSNATNHGATRNGVAGQARVVKCYNYQEEGHFARQCTKPKKPKNSAWFKEKMVLTKALESRAYLDSEQFAFLADNEDTIIPAQAAQEIPSPAGF
ncbi:retrotransposon protein, putative, unclassified [Tanacetum coccineum]